MKSKQPDPIYPLLLAFEKAEFCEKTVATARELTRGCDLLARATAQFGILSDQDVKARLKRVADEKEQLLDLIIKLSVTGVTITSQIKSLYEWMHDVQEGIILDVFTIRGQQSVRAQIDRVINYLYASMDQLMEGTERYRAARPASRNVNAAPASASSP